jgi:hypothetical protein
MIGWRVAMGLVSLLSALWLSTAEAACRRNSDCPSSQYCVDQQCRLPQCTRNSECRDGLYCTQGFCRRACADDRDCAGDARCRYLAPGQPPVAAVEAPASANPAYFQCQLPDGRMSAPLASGTPAPARSDRRASGGQCRLNSECASGLWCISGLCSVACVNNTDCPGGATCVANAPGGRAQCMLGDRVAHPVGSNTGMPRPINPAVRTQCSVNSDCVPNLKCADGLCLQACRASRDCPGGQSCLFQPPGKAPVPIERADPQYANRRESPTWVRCGTLPTPGRQASGQSGGQMGLEQTINRGIRGESTLRSDTDLPGADFRNFEMSAATHFYGCLDACLADPLCRAWAYVHPRPGAPARCWLKSGDQMAPRFNVGTTSGRKTRGSTSVSVPATGAVGTPLAPASPGMSTLPGGTAPPGSIAAIPAPGAVKGPGSFEPGMNRPGNDYHSFFVKPPEPRLCQQACANDAKCRAWVYVKPGVQGPEARCWLKAVAPAAKPDGCCTSGARP